MKSSFLGNIFFVSGVFCLLSASTLLFSSSDNKINDSGFLYGVGFGLMGIASEHESRRKERQSKENEYSKKMADSVSNSMLLQLQSSIDTVNKRVLAIGESRTPKYIEASDLDIDLGDVTNLFNPSADIPFVHVIAEDRKNDDSHVFKRLQEMEKEIEDAGSLRNSETESKEGSAERNK